MKIPDGWKIPDHILDNGRVEIQITGRYVTVKVFYGSVELLDRTFGKTRTTGAADDRGCGAKA